MKAPPRLLEDPGIAPQLRADLERAASPVDYDLAAGLAAFQQAVGLVDASSGAASAASEGAQQAVAAAGPGTGAGAGAGAAAGTGAGATAATQGAAAWIATKIGLAAAGTAVVVAGVATWPGSDPEPKRPPPPAQSSAAPSQAVEPAPEPPPTETAPRAAAPRPLDADTDAELRAETAELGRIKALLDEDPAEAYRLALQGHRKFRRGMLRQEREGLAVLALFKLDRPREAALRARAFLKRYPRSPLRDQIERELAASSAADTSSSP